MNEDITFCANNCLNHKCERHPRNIRDYRIPHSFAFLDGTDLCEGRKTNVRESQRDK